MMTLEAKRVRNYTQINNGQMLDYRDGILLSIIPVSCLNISSIHIYIYTQPSQTGKKRGLAAIKKSMAGISFVFRGLSFSFIHLIAFMFSPKMFYELRLNL